MVLYTTKCGYCDFTVTKHGWGNSELDVMIHQIEVHREQYDRYKAQEQEIQAKISHENAKLKQLIRQQYTTVKGKG